MPRILYVDEAGIGNPRDEPYLTVAGLLVHIDTQLNKLYAALEEVGRLMPEKCREEGLVLPPSFIYGGNGRFDEARHPEWKGRRMPILEALAEIPNKANILIASSILKRADFEEAGIELPPQKCKPGHVKKRKPGSATVAAHAVAYMACLLEADVWLRNNRKNENCMVIVEDNEEARSAIKYVHQYHQAKDMPLTDDIKSHFPLRRIREDPAFQEKRADHPLILADFVAFVLKRVSMNDPKISPLFAPWRKRMTALSLKPDDPLHD